MFHVRKVNRLSKTRGVFFPTCSKAYFLSLPALLTESKVLRSFLYIQAAYDDSEFLTSSYRLWNYRKAPRYFKERVHLKCFVQQVPARWPCEMQFVEL